MLTRTVVWIFPCLVICVIGCEKERSTAPEATGGAWTATGGLTGASGTPARETGGAVSGSGAAPSTTGGAGGTSGFGGTSSSAGRSNSGSRDSGARDAGTRYLFIDVLTITPDNDRCLPIALPTSDSNGLVDCQILFAGIATGCDEAGLSPVTDGRVVDAVTQRLKTAGFQSLPEGALCTLGQLPAPSSDAGPCLDNTVPGWCYMHGSCLPIASIHPCAQAICETPPLRNITYVVALLACH